MKPEDTVVTSAHFKLDEDDLKAIEPEFQTGTYVVERKLDNSLGHWIEGAPKTPSYGDIKKDLLRLAAHVDKTTSTTTATDNLKAITTLFHDSTSIRDERASKIKAWLEAQLPNMDESDKAEEERYDKLLSATEFTTRYTKAAVALKERLPIIVLFSNYYRVRPLIHLDHLATRIETKVLDDDQYDYGNECLLRLLGFTARKLSDLGKASSPSIDNPAALQTYKDQLDARSYQLNAASVRLTDEIKKVWNPNPNKAEADRLRVTADGQYLKVVVEDELGVEIELDQRSEGFQWLVSFFVVFFSEAEGAHKNAILLLDEPGLSLHALKQREFRETVSRLSKDNQTIYTTHSPFLVGPDELDLVRVVEMTDRKVGTKVHLTVAANDPASLLPLQEALGYDLAQSLFSQQRNLVLEGLTDLWYLEGTAALLKEAGIADLNEKIALVVANTASKVVYYATILHANNLKVAALLDLDAAGDQAAAQDTLVGMLGNKNILRTKDAYSGDVTKPEVEDMLRETLVKLAKSELGWDVEKTATAQPKRPLVDIFAAEVGGFSKYKLAKAYVKWTRDNAAGALTETERTDWAKLVGKINSSLK